MEVSISPPPSRLRFVHLHPFCSLDVACNGFWSSFFFDGTPIKIRHANGSPLILFLLTFNLSPLHLSVSLVAYLLSERHIVEEKTHNYAPKRRQNSSLPHRSRVTLLPMALPSVLEFGCCDDDASGGSKSRN
uniref:Uncharacterized protein n=1 Tax=Trypanosoma congolense (strain IL3000) TaxID=1068625 RepID=G0USP3_TRYCI|nr:hypothetical protein, unlikely [Trypanosoma congolense IL3000]